MSLDWFNTGVAGLAGAVVGYLFKGSYLPIWWHDLTTFIRFNWELEPMAKYAVMGCFEYRRGMEGEGPLLGHGLLERWGAPGEPPVSVRLTALGQRYSIYLIRKRASRVERMLSTEALAVLLRMHGEPMVLCARSEEATGSEAGSELCRADMMGPEWEWNVPLSGIVCRSLNQKYFSEHETSGMFWLMRPFWKRKLKKLEDTIRDIEFAVSR